MAEDIASAPEPMPEPEPVQAPPTTAGDRDIDDLIAELDRGEGTLLDAVSQLQSAADALDRAEDESAEAFETLEQAIASATDRESFERAKEALGRWNEAIEAADALVTEAATRHGQASTRFEEAVAGTLEELENRLSEENEASAAFVATLDDLGSGTDALDDGLDEAAGRLEETSALAGETAGAVAAAVDASVRQVDELLGGLGSIFDDASAGLIAQLEGDVQGCSGLLGSLEDEARKHPASAIDYPSPDVLEAIDETVALVDDLPLHWEQAHTAAATVADETLDEQKRELLEELQCLLESLSSAVGATAAWMHILPQLASLRSAAERVSEELESAEAD
jgi:hypothetical protein